MISKVSVELRWFANGQVPTDVQDWFANRLPGGEPHKEKSRKDLYFIVRDREDLGLKISRGSLELKWRQDSQPFSLSEPRLTGVKEIWIKEKWRYAKEYASNLEIAFGKPNLKGWRVEVNKNRSIRKYKVDTSGNVIDLAINEGADRLLKLELTGLTKRDRPWWTFAIEIAGEPQNLEEIFAGAVEKILNGYPQLDLQADHSHGYPHWLAHS
jgi:hypothetical protein